MFKHLHALAQTATLMITASAEDELLRVTITPTSNDGKKNAALKPLSLVATPEELDTDFGNAIAAWQAPRKSLLDQVAEAKANDEEDEKPAAKQATSTSTKKSEKAPPTPKEKSGRKAAGKKPIGAKTTLNPAAQWPFPGTKEANDAEKKSAGAGNEGEPPVVDPRQTSLIDPPVSDAAGGTTSESPTTALPTDATPTESAAPTAAPTSNPVFEVELF